MLQEKSKNKQQQTEAVLPSGVPAVPSLPSPVLTTAFPFTAVGKKMRYLPFWVCFVSLSIMTFSTIQLAADDRLSLLFTDE